MVLKMVRLLRGFDDNVVDDDDDEYDDDEYDDDDDDDYDFCRCLVV